MQMLSTEQVAQMLGVSRPTVWQMVQDRRFPNALIIKNPARDTIRIPLSDVEAFIQASQESA